MLDNLWRTIGLGQPVTLTQVTLRAFMCVVLCVCWFMLDVTGTILGWFVASLMAFMGGWWLGRAMGWIDDKVLAETVEIMANTLRPVVARTPVLEPELDYVVNPGEPCWMTVGNYSVRVLQQDGGGASVQVYHVNREDEDPIHTYEV